MRRIKIGPFVCIEHSALCVEKDVDERDIALLESHGADDLAFAGRFWDPISQRIRGPLGNDDDAFVAFENLEEREVPIVRAAISDEARAGLVLSAMTFEEDRPGGFQYEWAAVQINDFAGLNDPSDTVAGAQGDHFTTLLEWQPRTNPETTGLIARVQPGFMSNISFRERDSARIVAEQLEENGYHAVLLAGVAESAEEFDILCDYAEEIQIAAELVTLIEWHAHIDLDNFPFDMRIRTQRLPRLIPLE